MGAAAAQRAEQELLSGHEPMPPAAYAPQKPLLWGSAVLALVAGAAALHALATAPATAWFTASSVLWLGLLLIAFALALRGKQTFFAVIGALFSTIVLGRLYGTARFADGGVNTSNDPLLLAETGPGVPSAMWLFTALAVLLMLWLAIFVARHRDGTASTRIGDENWALAFVRIYVGMMFIPHFSGHIFAGPTQFAIFESYFGSIGLHPAAGAVVLGGVAEVAAGIGLSLGLFTRLSALIGAIFLYLSMLWGNHFPVGYIWILPTGGWEFGIFWAVMVGLFAVIGGGPVSLDRVLFRRREPRS